MPMSNYKEILHKFLDEMPVNKRYSVKPEQIEPIKAYMREKELQGGLNFSGDYKTIYKNRLPLQKDKLPL